MNVGWIGLGRMGFPMAERVLASGQALTVWNRTRSKAEPLAKKGAKLADKLEDLAGVDILFTMVATGDDVREVCFGNTGVFADGRNRTPKLLVRTPTSSRDLKSTRQGNSGRSFVNLPLLRAFAAAL